MDQPENSYRPLQTTDEGYGEQFVDKLIRQFKTFVLDQYGNLIRDRGS